MGLGRCLLIGTIALASCRRRTPEPPAQPDDDAQPVFTKKDSGTDPSRFVLVGKDFVDLETRTVVHSLETRPMLILVEADGAYVSSDRHLSAIDLPSGKERWSYVDPSPGLCRPVADARRLYAACTNAVYAFDRKTGARSVLVPPKRTVLGFDRVGRSLLVQLDDRSVSFVDVDGGGAHVFPSTATTELQYFLGTETRALVTSLNLSATPPRTEARSYDADGVVGWSRDLGAVRAYPRLSTAHHALFASGPIERAFVLSLADGSIVHDHKGETLAMSENAAGQVDLLFDWPAARPTAIDAYDAKSDTLRWKLTLPCNGYSKEIIEYGRLVIIAGHEPDGDGCVVAVDRDTGAQRWTATLAAGEHTGLRIGGRNLFIHGDEVVVVGAEVNAEHLDVFAAATGERLFTHSLKM